MQQEQRGDVDNTSPHNIKALVAEGHHVIQGAVGAGCSKRISWVLARGPECLEVYGFRHADLRHGLAGEKHHKTRSHAKGGSHHKAQVHPRRTTRHQGTNPVTQVVTPLPCRPHTWLHQATIAGHRPPPGCSLALIRCARMLAARMRRHSRAGEHCRAPATAAIPPNSRSGAADAIPLGMLGLRTVKREESRLRGGGGREAQVNFRRPIQARHRPFTPERRESAGRVGTGHLAAVWRALGAGALKD